MLSKECLFELREYVESRSPKYDAICFESAPAPMSRAAASVGKALDDQLPTEELEDFIQNHRKPSFAQVLFEFIDRRGLSDSEIYKKAGLDRRHFSKIRSNSAYRIGKSAAIALALALELDSMETDRLLNAAGYSLSDHDLTDLVIQFCLEKQIYDIQDVNQALDYFSLQPLSGVLE